VDDALAGAGVQAAVGHGQAEHIAVGLGLPKLLAVFRAVRRHFVVAAGDERLPGEHHAERLGARHLPRKAVLHSALHFIELLAELRGLGENLFSPVASFSFFQLLLQFIQPAFKWTPLAGEVEVFAAVQRAQLRVALKIGSRRGDDHVVAFERGELVRLVRLDETQRAGFAGAKHQIVAGQQRVRAALPADDADAFAVGAIEHDGVVASGRDVEPRVRREHVALRREVGLFLLPLDFAGGGVKRGDEHALGREHPGGAVGQVADNDDAGPQRPTGNDPRVAGDAVVLQAKLSLPNPLAGFGVETVSAAVVRADEHPSLDDRRGQAHRPFGEERPARLAGGRVEAVDFIVRRRAVIEQTVGDDGVVGVIEDLPRLQVVNFVPAVPLGLAAPSGTRGVFGAMHPPVGERGEQRFGGDAGAGIVVLVGRPIRRLA